jgi:hypothetical protein
MKIIAHENNEILYGQDMQCFKGLPANIEFDAKVFKWENDMPTEIVLESYGYGQLIPYDNKSYGNGKIYVYLSHMKEKDGLNVIKKVKEEIMI